MTLSAVFKFFCDYCVPGKVYVTYFWPHFNLNISHTSAVWCFRRVNLSNNKFPSWSVPNIFCESVLSSFGKSFGASLSYFLSSFTNFSCFFLFLLSTCSAYIFLKTKFHPLWENKQTRIYFQLFFMGIMPWLIANW